MNVIARLEYELAYYDSAVHRFNHYTTRTPSWTDIAGRLFVNGPVGRSSIPGRVVPKTQKMVFDASLLNSQLFKVHIEGKWSYQVKGVASFFTLRCSCLWKTNFGSLLSTISKLFTTIYIYIYSAWVSEREREREDWGREREREREWQNQRQRQREIRYALK